jgi:hypothetical protein
MHPYCKAPPSQFSLRRALHVRTNARPFDPTSARYGSRNDAFRFFPRKILDQGRWKSSKAARAQTAHASYACKIDV